MSTLLIVVEGGRFNNSWVGHDALNSLREGGLPR
jgi:hypothetical protein